jgi:hypothetical protein
VEDTVAIYSVRYRCKLIEGSDNIEVPIGDRTSVERTPVNGDILFVIGGAPPNHTPDTYGDLYYMADGQLKFAPVDVKPGDLIITNCAVADVPTQSGTAVVICTDGTFNELSSPGPGDTSDTITPDDSPHDITTSIVVADTTLGNVTGLLPGYETPRTIRAGNLTGDGTFELRPTDGQKIDGQDYIVLQSGEKATLVATGTTWEVW